MMSNNKSIYIISSIRERLALQEFMPDNNFIITQMSSIEGYAKWDAVIISGRTEMLLEIKARDWNSTSFSTWILEQDKYDELKLIQSKKNRGMVPFYVNVFNDGIAFWNLDETTPQFNLRNSKKSVMGQSGEMKDKSVAMLPLSEATFYPFQFDFDSLNDKSEKTFESIYPNREYTKLFRNNKNK